MFVEKIAALMGEFPAQFQPLMYVLCLIVFLWIFDTFMTIFRALVSR